MTVAPLKTVQPNFYTSFRLFVDLIWQHLDLPAPTPIQLDICDWLQNGPRRTVTEAFRGVGKSWLTSAYVCWRLMNNPQMKVLVVSASKTRADDFSTFVQRLIREVECLQFLKPKEGQRDSKISFDVGPARPDHAPSVKSVGITGQIAGSRADLIVPDDVEVPNNSATQQMRDKLSEAVKEFDAVLKPNGEVKYLGTPQTEQSLYNGLPARGYKVRIWPSEIPASVEQYGNKIAPYVLGLIEKGAKPGDVIDPLRFNAEDLMERKASFGRSGYALQFMLDTRLSDADRYPLKLSDLIVMSLDTRRGPTQVAWGNEKDMVHVDVNHVGFNGDRIHRPAWIAKDVNGQNQFADYTGSVMAIDPSGRGKDETGYAVVKILHGTLFLLAVGGFRDGYSEDTLTSLARVAEKHQVNYIIVEANFGDGMFSQLLKPILAKTYPCTVEEVKHSVQKEKRIIDTLEPIISGHRLVVDLSLFEKDYKSTDNLPMEEGLKYQFFYQLTRITREKGALVRDDRLDSVAMAVGYWVEHMGRDKEVALKEHKQDLLDKELEKFMHGVHASGSLHGSRELKSKSRNSWLGNYKTV